MPQKTLVTFFTAENFKIPKLLKIKIKQTRLDFLLNINFYLFFPGAKMTVSSDIAIVAIMPQPMLNVMPFIIGSSDQLPPIMTSLQ